MPKILIIADDLTGAADCGVVFAERGMKAIVVLSRPGETSAYRGLLPSPEVLSVDADTRGLGPEHAAEAVARLVDAYANSDGGDGLLFKKVDSTLRGNVAAELAGVLGARRANAGAREGVAILLAPAFPAHGRTTVGGRQMVHGRPLPETGMGSDSAAGIGAMLSEARLSFGVIGLEIVRAGADPLMSSVLRIANQADVVVCDAETEDDLRAIANAGMGLGPRTIWAGSAGLARHIPDAAGWARDPEPKRLERLQIHGPTLLVVGSAAAVSLAQAHALAAAPDLSVFTLSSGALSDGGAMDAARITGCLERGNDVLVQLDSSEASARNDGRSTASALGRMLQPCGQCAGALVATGGETARAILDAWAVQSLQLLGEVEPGLPYSVVECAGRSLLVLTKAGGFGKPDTLIRCHDFVRRRARDSETAGLLAAGRKR
jgi:uncharacterized protein YgbK (DUF1537 family)